MAHRPHFSYSNRWYMILEMRKRCFAPTDPNNSLAPSEGLRWPPSEVRLTNLAEGGCTSGGAVPFPNSNKNHFLCFQTVKGDRSKALLCSRPCNLHRDPHINVHVRKCIHRHANLCTSLREEDRSWHCLTAKRRRNEDKSLFKERRIRWRSHCSSARTPKEVWEGATELRAREDEAEGSYNVDT